MSKAKRIGRILMIALGVLIVCLSARGLMDVPVYKSVLGSAIYLEEPVILPENEGKTVIVHGKVEMTKPAYDEELGLTIDTVKAYRYDKEYTQTSGEKSTYKYKWVSRGGKTVVGEAALGNFEIDKKTLIGFPADADYDKYDDAEISAGGYNMAYGRTAEGAMTDRLWVIAGGTYYYDDHEYSTDLDISHFQRELSKAVAADRNGAKAYSYKVYDEDRYEAMTIAGVQKGNMLVVHEKLGPMAETGVLTKDELSKALSGNIIGASVAFVVIGILLIFLGLRPNKKNKKKNKERKKG